MKLRIAELQKALREGRPLREIVTEETPPLIVHLLSESVAALHEHGNRARRTEALALRAEGVTMDEIARVFRVSRQRISALVRQPRA